LVRGTEIQPVGRTLRVMFVLIKLGTFEGKEVIRKKIPGAEVHPSDLLAILKNLTTRKLLDYDLNEKEWPREKWRINQNGKTHYYKCIAFLNSDFQIQNTFGLEVKELDIDQSNHNIE